jgi:hypothetical protein
MIFKINADKNHNYHENLRSINFRNMKKELTNLIVADSKIIEKIFLIRGEKVMLDRDLAEMYEVETKVFNQSVKRNISRFPEDFMFQLTQEEWDFLRSQFVTLEKLPGKGHHPKYLPYGFTEQGVAMLSSVLKSEKSNSGKYSNHSFIH